MIILRKVLLSLILGCTTLLAHAAPNLVLNGDFETPLFANWDYSVGEGFQVGTDITGSPAAHPSNVYIDGSFNFLGILSQTINNLTIGDTYTLTFEIQRWITAGTTVDNEALLRIGGTEYWHELDVTTDWITKEFSFLATSTSMLLEFGNSSRDLAFGTQIDNILLALADDPPTGDVPEPASLGLLLGGLAMLGAARRRTQRH